LISMIAPMITMTIVTAANNMNLFFLNVNINKWPQRR
jgi:hypothetical protein